jgi:2-polyprenyl-3-methyl-5-hydroxy-6-metoxy-1,4-benzoquinol methylase
MFCFLSYLSPSDRPTRRSCGTLASLRAPQLCRYAKIKVTAPKSIFDYRMNVEKYKWDPSGYSHHSGSQLEWAKELIDKLQLRGNERILDIGCGDGKVTKLISESVPDGEVIAGNDGVE